MRTGGSVAKNPPANARDERGGFDPWVGKIPWERKWQPTPVFLPGESHGQQSLQAIVHGIQSQTRLRDETTTPLAGAAADREILED